MCKHHEGYWRPSTAFDKSKLRKKIARMTNPLALTGLAALVMAPASHAAISCQRQISVDFDSNEMSKFFTDAYQYSSAFCEQRSQVVDFKR